MHLMFGCIFCRYFLFILILDLLNQKQSSWDKSSYYFPIYGHGLCLLILLSAKVHFISVDESHHLTLFQIQNFYQNSVLQAGLHSHDVVRLYANNYTLSLIVLCEDPQKRRYSNYTFMELNIQQLSKRFQIIQMGFELIIQCF